MKKLTYLGLLLCTATGLSFTSCSKDNDSHKLNQTELALTAGESFKLEYNGDCTWESEEPLIAEVDNIGNVTANRVGETTIWANQESCKVKVSPKYNTYMEPYTDWGASESDVINYMAGYTYTVSSSSNTMYFEDTDNDIVYMYLFENKALSSSAIMANIISKGEEIIDFLLERYVVVYANGSDYTVFMCSIDRKIAIGVSLNAISGVILVGYMPYDPTSANTKSAFPWMGSLPVQGNAVAPAPEYIDAISGMFDRFMESGK